MQNRYDIVDWQVMKDFSNQSNFSSNLQVLLHKLFLQSDTKHEAIFVRFFSS